MMTPVVRGVYVADTSGIVPGRDTKHCVCVSVASGRYFVINTRHDERYDDFALSATDYDFLRGEDHFLGCVRTFEIPPCLC